MNPDPGEDTERNPKDIEPDSQRDYELTTAEKLRKLPWGIGFSTANSLFTQLTFFGSIFVLYLNELGFNKSQIGILLSLLPFLVLVALFSMGIVDRWGRKKTTLTFWFARTAVTIGLLFAPFVLLRAGEQAAFVYVAGITASFSFFRGISLTSLVAWQKEYIPDQIRGKYSAYSNIATSVASFMGVALSGYALNRTKDLSSYIFLFSLAVLFGFISVFSAAHIPGGAVRSVIRDKKRRLSEVFIPLRDRGFLLFLFGSGLLTLAADPLGVFLPLFMGERVGLSSGDIAYLGMGTLLGAIFTSYFWGWAADRYGSRPVMLSGLLLKALHPIFLILLPVLFPGNLPIAMLVYFYGGFAGLGWTIGAGRLLFVNIVSAPRAPEYSAIHQSFLGVLGGFSALIAGWFLERFANFEWHIGEISLDEYTILFIIGILFPLGAIFIMRYVRDDGAFGVAQFAGLFYHGNPFMAVESMIRFRLAKDETSIVNITERLGQSHSPLTVEELLEALRDPRFYVRFEALISIGRRGPDERLQAALVEILNGSDPALSVIAAWAMGRIGDTENIRSLRASLSSNYRSIRTHAARSLATLDDTDIIPVLEDQLAVETDFGLRVAYVTSLAKLGDQRVGSEILRLLHIVRDDVTAKELGLSLSRLFGDESYYIQLLRNVSQDPGTALSQSVYDLQRKVAGLTTEEENEQIAIECMRVFGHGDLESGTQLLAEWAQDLPLDLVDGAAREVLDACIIEIKQSKSTRLEYAILIIDILRQNI